MQMAPHPICPVLKVAVKNAGICEAGDNVENHPGDNPAQYQARNIDLADFSGRNVRSKFTDHAQNG
jgi:hypothetical protein